MKVRDAGLGGRLGMICAPTLVIAGADDPAAGGGGVHLRLHPPASLAVIPDAAHLANIEQPEAVTQAIVDHLSAVLREGR